MTAGFNHDELRRRRLSHGWSQEKVAELLGVTRQALSYWELGERSVDVDLLPLFAHLYECRIDDLFHALPPLELDRIRLRLEKAVA